MALGLKRKRSDSRVYTLFSDGELGEGSVWEAIMSASHCKLDNLIAIVDVNNQQADGPSTEVTDFEPLVGQAARPSAGSRSALTATTSTAVVAAFDAAKAHPEPKPRMIIADTRWARACRSWSSARRTTSSASKPHEWQLALDSLDAGRPA